MAKRIEKKTWPKYFEKIQGGSKNYDMRIADFDIEVGDILVLKEWNPATKEYSGRVIEKRSLTLASLKILNFILKKKLKSMDW